MGKDIQLLRITKIHESNEQSCALLCKRARFNYKKKN